MITVEFENYPALLVPEVNHVELDVRGYLFLLKSVKDVDPVSIVAPGWKYYLIEADADTPGDSPSN